MHKNTGQILATNKLIKTKPDNKIKTISIFVILILVGFGLGRWFVSNNVEITDLRNQLASFQEQIISL